MKVFVGVGLGPIQTGIFMSGACRGGFDRIVIAEVDDKLRNAINSNGGVVTINGKTLVGGKEKRFNAEIPLNFRK